MRRRSKRPAPPVELHDFDDIKYEVIVHMPLDDPQPSRETITAAVCHALDLPPERVETRMFFPWMGG